MPSAHSSGALRAAKSAIFMVFTVVFLASAGSQAIAQDQDRNANRNGARPTAEMQMTKPAPILVIYKEDLKAGHTASHDQLEANFARTYAKVPGARHYLAMNSLSGPTQSWFVQPYATLEDVEKEFQASENAPAMVKTNLERIAGGEDNNLTKQTAITTVYRDDLSYNSDVTDLPKMRYVEVITFHVKPGHDAEFMEAATLVKNAYEKTNVPMGWACYQVFAGAPSGTYYIFRAIDSLAKADPTNRERMQTVHQALGEDGQKRLAQLTSEAIAMEETDFYAFNPKTSFAPPEFAAADSFWQQPAQVAQVGTSGKATSTKTSAVKNTKRKPQ
jgi:hypothetical protein